MFGPWYVDIKKPSWILWTVITSSSLTFSDVLFKAVIRINLC